VRVNLLFFASLVDIVGARKLLLELTDPSSVDDLLARLETDHPGLSPYRPILLTAVNQEYVEADHVLADGDEVAIFPPVSGGQTSAEALTREGPDQLYQITFDPIDTQQISHDLLRDQDGAVCVFEGVVRNNSKGKTTRYLVYESYETMALAKMEEIGGLIREMWDIGAVGIIHRLGRLEIGEASIVIIVTSPHRGASFDACHWAIDRLKKVVPIWKKEFFEDGEVWVEGQG
jgi:molybdopterin converting factor subunit 1